MRLRALTVVLLVVAAACATPDSTPATLDLESALGYDLSDLPPTPDLDPAVVAAGEQVYQASCAACHGVDASGDPDWKTPNEDGSFKPPPHDVTGHTWHHPDPLLADIVTNGGGFEGTRMPPFGTQLSPEEITAVLTYLKSLWGQEERDFQWQATWQDAQRSGE